MEGLVNGILPFHISRITDRNAIVDGQLQVTQRNTTADIHTEIRLFQFPIDITQREILISHLERHLRTGTYEDTQRTENPEVFSQIQRDVDGFLMNLFLIDSHGLTIIIQGCNIKIKADDRYVDKEIRTNEEAFTIIAFKHIMPERIVNKIDATLHTEAQEFGSMLRLNVVKRQQTDAEKYNP